MKHKYIAVVSAGLLGLLLPLHAFGQDQGVSYVARSGLPLSVDPGGSPRAQLYIDAPVKTLEQRGEWVKVSVEGWVRSSSLSKEPTSQGNVRVGGEGPLAVVSYNARFLEEEERGRWAALTIKIKNSLPTTVHSWSGILVALKGGQVLFREKLSQDKLNIPPGGEGEATFNWKENEAVYKVLKQQPTGLDLRILQVRAQ